MWWMYNLFSLTKCLHVAGVKYQLSYCLPCMISILVKNIFWLKLGWVFTYCRESSYTAYGAADWGSGLLNRYFVDVVWSVSPWGWGSWGPGQIRFRADFLHQAMHTHVFTSTQTEQIVSADCCKPLAVNLLVKNIDAVEMPNSN